MVSKDGIIIDRREMLRVKLKSLAAESKIIRREEKRSRGMLCNELHEHRIGVVRSEARHTHLAYGFIRGRTYECMERSSETKPNWERVRKLCQKYGPRDFVEPECMSSTKPIDSSSTATAESPKRGLWQRLAGA